MSYIEHYILENKEIVGEIQGCLYTKDDCAWTYYLEKEFQSKKELELLITVLRQEVSVENIAVLYNIDVVFNNRKKGYGKQLFSLFENSVNSQHPIILVADMLTSQTKGFSLIGWYQNLGFLVFSEQRDTLIMVKSLNKNINQKLGLYQI